MSRRLSAHFLHIVLTFCSFFSENSVFFFICSRDCCQLWASELELFFFFFFFLRLSWFLNNSQWLNEAGKWSRRDGAECFFISERLFWNKSGGEGWGEQKAGEEINGLAKEWVSYTGIRWDKPRACRLGGGWSTAFTSKEGWHDIVF